MEDVLEVYQRPYDGNEVLVCMDETSKQQFKETRVPRPAAPGLSAAYDYEYERNGVSSLFMLFAPLDGWRRVEVRERRTKVDWAHVIKKLVDEDYPDRDRIVLVMDNLNTHKLSSLYEAFEPAEARRIAERLEIHYTPKHGSWLNMAEIEIGVLGSTVPGPTDCQSRHPARRGQCLAESTQPGCDTSGLALHYRGCAHQAKVTLPINTKTLNH